MAKKPTKVIAEPGLSCETCRYWIEGTEQHDEARWGDCHRYPPQLVVMNADGATDEIAPATLWTVLPHWCGEHAPRLQ